MNRIAQSLIVATPIMLSCTAALAQSSISMLPLTNEERHALFPLADEIEQGKALAASACARCHGLDGISVDENLPHLAGQRTIYLYRDLLSYQNGTRTDESMRNAVEFLAEDALLKVSAYYANLMPPRSASAPATTAPDADESAEDPVQAGKAATAGCAGCHGATGNSSVPGMPNLTAQHPDYFAAAMKAYQSDARQDAMMKMLVASLDDDTIQSMGMYYALQDPQRTAASGTGDSQAGSVLAEPCAGCHGSDGNTAAADTPTLAGQDAAYLAKTLRDYQNGQRDHALMVAAMEGLNDADIDALATFYAEQEPAARQVRRPLVTAEWIARCDRCHGLGGNSADPRYPSLAGQHPKYLIRVLEAYGSGERSNLGMHAMAEPLTQTVIERVAAHYASKEAKSVVYVALPVTDAGEN